MLCVAAKLVTIGTPSISSTPRYSYSNFLDSVVGTTLLMSDKQSFVTVPGVLISFIAVFTNASTVRFQLWRPSNVASAVSSNVFFKLVYEKKFTPAYDQLYTLIEVSEC